MSPAALWLTWNRKWSFPSVFYFQWSASKRPGYDSCISNRNNLPGISGQGPFATVTLALHITGRM